MPGTHLPPNEMDELLAQPLIAVLATYRQSDGVLLSPVWYEWRDVGFNILVNRHDVKVRHVQRNPSASIVVAEQLPPYRGVEARGQANLLDTGYTEAQRRMASRYLAEIEPYRGYAPATLGQHGLVLRIRPDELRSWTFHHLFPEMVDQGV